MEGDEEDWCKDWPAIQRKNKKKVPVMMKVEKGSGTAQWAESVWCAGFCGPG